MITFYNPCLPNIFHDVALTINVINFEYKCLWSKLKIPPLRANAANSGVVEMVLLGVSCGMDDLWPCDLSSGR